MSKHRTKLRFDEKCEIALRKVETSDTDDTDEKNVIWFSQTAGKCISCTVAGRAVRAGFHQLSPYEPDTTRCRRHAPRWPQLDEGLFSWFTRCAAY